MYSTLPAFEGYYAVPGLRCSVKTRVPGARFRRPVPSSAAVLQEETDESESLGSAAAFRALGQVRVRTRRREAIALVINGIAVVLT